MTKLCSRPEGFVYLVLTILLSRAVLRKSLFDRIPAYQHTNIWSFLTLMIGYYGMLGVIIAFTAYEIARLAQQDLGIGLLPFALVGLAFAGTTHLTPFLWRVLPNYKLANCVFFAMFFAVCVAKQNALSRLPKERPVLAAPGRDVTGWSVARQRTLLGVSLGFYAALMGFEVALVFHKSPFGRKSGGGGHTCRAKPAAVEPDGPLLKAKKEVV